LKIITAVVHFGLGAEGSGINLLKIPALFWEIWEMKLPCFYHSAMVWTSRSRQSIVGFCFRYLENWAIPPFC
jgi:hypothetical protein